MNLADLTQTVETLRQEVHRLSRQVAKLQHPQGRIFIASRDSDAGAFTEQIPREDASDLQTLDNGRTVGESDTGMTLIRLPDGSVPVLAFPNGDTQAYAELLPSCDPDVTATPFLGPDGEGSETADTTSYNFRGIPTASVELNVQTRTVYNAAGDQKLYGFGRRLIFICEGGNLHLLSISHETRYEIDIPEDCTPP